MKYLRLAFIGAALAVITACGSASGDTGGEADPADADYSITTADMAFDQSTLTVTAGEAFTLALVNEDSAPHNVAIFTDSSASEPVFVGELVTGDTIVYEIPALEPGEYFFRCDLHPSMTGTLVVEG